ncbi:hypothetical protein A8990_1414 [Paenibacillus taihuensis]|uniref:TniQ protein n=1 Tax=Paenibacillus taihuensis TaxID=1156355 RepID=A0A3D9QW12_9BACL|nr:hypothetical protein A8990_1414 [Paenibacillus taihuensis]
MKLIWRKNWLSDFESPFSVIDKICYANHITQKDFHTAFSCAKNQEYSHPLINYLDYTNIERSISNHLMLHFKSSVNVLSLSFYNGDIAPEIYFCKDLYYCNSCSLHGYHSLLFQSKFIMECPFHQTPLTNLCRKCGFPLSYRQYKSQSISQCCRNCSESILRHHDVYPNYPTYTVQDILSDELLRFFSLDEKDVQYLQNIHISLYGNKKGHSSLEFYINLIDQFNAHVRE